MTKYVPPAMSEWLDTVVDLADSDLPCNVSTVAYTVRVAATYREAYYQSLDRFDELATASMEKTSELRAERDAFVNAVLENTPEHYDGDEGGQQIAVRYVRDLERVADLAAAVAERLACLHDFDPECARCEWLTPFRGALRILRGEWTEEEADV